MSPADKDVRARVAGRQQKEQQTAWRVEIGSRAFRCCAVYGGWVVEARVSDCWQSVAKGNDPQELLKRFATIPTVIRLLAERRRSIGRTP